MKRDYRKKEIIIINEDTGERLNFSSVNKAAAYLGTNFSNVQRAAVYNGVINGWRVYESPETIRLHIRDLEEQLRVLNTTK